MPAVPVEWEFKQPDGATFTARLRGDEKVNWTETGDGYAIEKGDDGYWYYVLSYDGDRANLSQTRADEKPSPEIQKDTRPTRSISTEEKETAAVRFSAQPLGAPTPKP